MNVAIDYIKLKNKIPSRMIEEIKNDVKFIQDVSILTNVRRFIVKDFEHSVAIGICTESLIIIYRFNKRRNSFRKTELSIADYYFVRDFMEGGK